MKYKHWEVFETMPEGWKIDKTCGSPLTGAVFITNGKSILNGGKRALLKIDKKKTFSKQSKLESKDVEFNKTKKSSKSYIIDGDDCIRAVNELARKKFEENLLKDILVDLMICDIEGWGKREYILELKNLIVGLLDKKYITPDYEVKTYDKHCM